MNKISKSSLKDIIIIISIFFVFTLVFLVFYTEIIKSNKIRDSEKIFNIVKQELTKESVEFYMFSLLDTQVLLLILTDVMHLILSDQATKAS